MSRCLTLLALAASVKASENCTLCGFDAADAADCVVPGQLGDGELIPWARASQECLDVFSVRPRAGVEDAPRLRRARGRQRDRRGDGATFLCIRRARRSRNGRRGRVGSTL